MAMIQSEVRRVFFCCFFFNETATTEIYTLSLHDVFRSAGPEPRGHVLFKEEHVLPFGYWLSAKQWIPTVHVREEFPDGKRLDPYDIPSTGHPNYAKYSRHCAQCHTTIPFGDRLLSNAELVGRHSPFQISLFLSGYLGEAHPELWDPRRRAVELSDNQLFALTEHFQDFKTPERIVTRGISCEACHLGAKQHVRDKTQIGRAHV